MGKFSGILICSDFDGTLAEDGQIVEKNIDAIRYFQDNGGLFSVITGRTVNFLRNRENQLVCNTYVGCVNGAVVYDYPNGKVVRTQYLEGDILTPLLKIHRELTVSKNIVIFHDDNDVVIHDSTDDFEEQLRNELLSPVLKVMIRTTRPYMFAELDRIREILGERFEQARSWQTGLEIQNRGNNKGNAVTAIARLAGAKRIICVGDYENDISLLGAADTSYAMQNAIDSLKQVADRITVHVSEGAIAAIIRDIEAELEK